MTNDGWQMLASAWGEPLLIITDVVLPELDWSERKGTAARYPSALTTPFQKYGDVFRPSGADGTKPGVSEANPRVEEKRLCAPGTWLQALPAPLPERVHL